VSTAELSGENEHDIPLQSTELLRKLLSYSQVNAIAGQRSDVEGFKQAVFHGACIVITGTVIRRALAYYSQYPDISGLILVCLALLVHGYILSFLFMPLHECVHMTAFHSREANHLVGLATGLATFRPPIHYKCYHFAHHRHTGNPEKDPELSDTLLDPDIKSISGYLLYLSSIPFWLSRPWTIIRHSRGLVDPKSEPYLRLNGVVTEARIFLVVYFLLFAVSLFTRSTFLLFYWLIPTVIGQPFLRYYLIAEHTGCALGPNMIANTRTTKTLALPKACVEYALSC
jgi:fatty acid desaturase